MIESHQSREFDENIPTQNQEIETIAMARYCIIKKHETFLNEPIW